MAQKKKKSKKKTVDPKRKRWARLLWLAVLSPFIAIGLLLLIASFSELPDFKTIENPNNELATEILTADGELLGKYYKQNRTNVDYEDLSPHLINALIATEDERFHEHAGIDFRGTVRAVA